MKRQTLRMFIFLISFAVFPITVIYLAPAPPIVSLNAGVINLSVITIATIFISGFIFRRAFCGWLCPGGGCRLVATLPNNCNQCGTCVDKSPKEILKYSFGI